MQLKVKHIAWWILSIATYPNNAVRDTLSIPALKEELLSS